MPILLILGAIIAAVGFGLIVLGKSQKSDPEDPPEQEDDESNYQFQQRVSRYNLAQSDSDGQIPWRGIGLGVAAVGLLLVGLTFTTVVPSQNVGVVTSFNKPTGRALDAGLHFKAPWHKVHDMDGTVQLIDNIGSASEEETNGVKDRGRTEVRIASTNATMFVDNAFRWKIKKDAAPGLYLDWRKGGGNIVEDNISNGLVEKELAAAMNVALADYNPYSGDTTGQTAEDLQNEVREILVGKPGIDPLTQKPYGNGKIGEKIEVVSYSIIMVDFDEGTKTQIRLIQEEVQRTKQAEQSVKTAEQERLRNLKLAQTVSKDPNVLVAKCLDAQRQIIDKWDPATEGGNPLQGSPSCWPVNGVTLTKPAP